MSSLLLRNPNFRCLWLGQLVSQIGTKIYLIALSWYFVNDLNDNQGLVAMLMSASLPLLVLGPLAGPLVDRFDRRRILIAADTCSALITAGMIACVVLHLHQAAIFVCVFLLGIAEVFFNPAAQALIPSIVAEDEVQEAQSNLSLEYNLARFTGAAIGGVLVGWTDVPTAIAINAASFLFSAFTSMLMRTPPHAAPETTGHLLADLRDGLRYVRSAGVVFHLLILSSLLNVFFVAIVVYLPILIDDRLHMSAAAFGTAEACAPVGSVAAALWFSRFKVTDHLAWARGAILVLGVSFLVIWAGRSYAAVLAAMTLMGATLSVANIHISSYFVKNVNPDYLGRFFNLMETIAYGSFPLAYLLAGALVARFDIYHLFLTNGAALLALGAAGYLLLRTETPTAT